MKIKRPAFELAPGRFECTSNFISPYPSTDIYENSEKYELDILDSKFVTGVSDEYIFMVPKGMTKEQLVKDRTKFSNVIRDAMLSSVPRLDSEIIKDHLSLTCESIYTQWARYFLTDEICASWARFNSLLNYTDKISDGNSVSDLYPKRCFSIRELDGNNFFWPLRGRTITFSKYELKIIELCSGKLTIGEIVELLYRGLENDEVTKKQVKKDLISFLEQLSSELLVVFRVASRKLNSFEKEELLGYV